MARNPWPYSEEVRPPVAAYRRNESAKAAFTGRLEATATRLGAPAQRLRRLVARIVELSNRFTVRVCNAQLLLLEQLRLLWNRAMRTGRFVVYDAPRWLLVTLPQETWLAAGRFARWLFVTLPRRAWNATRQFLRWLFVTLPRRAWNATRQFLLAGSS